MGEHKNAEGLTKAQERSLRAAFKRASVAHIVVDVQRGYCEPQFMRAHQFPASWEGRLGPVVGNIDAFTRRSRPFLRQCWLVHVAEEALTVPDAARALSSLSPAVRRAQMEKELYEVTAAQKDMIVGKPLWDGFRRTDLDRRLRRDGIDTVVVSGFFTCSCVKQTVETALKKKYNAVLLRDLTEPGWRDKDDVCRKLAAQGALISDSGTILRLAGAGG